MLMSREKIGQLFMVGFEGTSVTPDLAAFIKEYKPDRKSTRLNSSHT